jgi:hypothetical protein
MLLPEPVQYRKTLTQFGTGMLRYRTEIPDADAGGICLDAGAQ